MITFNNDPKVKDFYINRVKMHQFADETELGVPRILAKFEDRIFEGLSNEHAKEFPLQFLQAIPVGVDLKDVYKKFFIWMLTDPAYGVIKFAKKESTIKAIQDVSDLLEKSLIENVTGDQFLEVRNAAYAAYAYAYAAYAYAYADAAAYAYARKNHFYIMGQKLIQIISETTNDKK